MGETPRKQIEEIERTQDALRDSIVQAKQLADKTHDLLQKHRKTLERDSD